MHQTLAWFSPLSIVNDVEIENSKYPNITFNKYLTVVFRSPCKLSINLSKLCKQQNNYSNNNKTLTVETTIY